ncbi:hypothetical protein ACOZ4L_09725 [Haloplanus ruber]|uniref:Uncharacterized protein n=1 Tax=Haloplanus ruber TaxID=869892 RepID=A0ABD6CW51_9EURY|nr:hypothetical protein [Haloplanus ruber]
MDRISAIRNVEEALRAFEAGEADLAATEERVLAALRTYATEFEGSGLGAYAGHGAEAVEDVVVIASSRAEARDRIAEHAPATPASFDVERLD